MRGKVDRHFDSFKDQNEVKVFFVTKPEFYTPFLFGVFSFSLFTDLCSSQWETTSFHFHLVLIVSRMMAGNRTKKVYTKLAQSLLKGVNKCVQQVLSRFLLKIV